MKPWEVMLIKRASELFKHGTGQLTLNIGNYKKDKTSVVIVAGESTQYIVDKYTDDED